jgi:hypothetical protein
MTARAEAPHAALAAHTRKIRTAMRLRAGIRSDGKNAHQRRGAADCQLPALLRQR